MNSTTEQRLKDTFEEAIRRPDRAVPVQAIEHGPTAGRRPDRSLFMLAIDRIRPAQSQVRTLNKSVTDDEVRELAESITAVGIENPLTVRYLRDEDMYELIAGERRYTAAKLGQLSEVPVKLMEADETTVRRLQIHENIHRANLTPLELADALQSLIDDGDTPDSLTRLLCKSPAYVQKALGLARQASDEAKEYIATHGDRFTSLDLLYDVTQLRKEDQLPLLQQINDLNLTREQVRDITAPLKHARTLDGSRTRGRKPKERPAVRTWEVPSGAKVTVVLSRAAASDDDYRQALQQAIELT